MAAQGEGSAKKFPYSLYLMRVKTSMHLVFLCVQEAAALLATFTVRSSPRVRTMSQEVPMCDATRTPGSAKCKSHP